VVHVPSQTMTNDMAPGRTSANGRGCLPGPVVGIWLEMGDAALADARGEGLVRWVRALVAGLDDLPDVGTIVIPCATGSRRLVETLFADAGTASCGSEAGGPPVLMSPKLRIMTAGRDQSRAAAACERFSRRRGRLKDRLAGFGVRPNPLTWPAGLRPLVATVPSSLGLVLTLVGRVGRIAVTTVRLLALEVTRPFVPRVRPVFDDIAADLHARTGESVWIVPNPTWGAAAGLPGRLLVNVADIVYREFPLPDVPAEDIRAHQRSLAALAVRAEAVVCFSHHVAERQVRPVLGGIAKRIAVVPHAPFATTSSGLDDEASRRLLAEDLRRHFATSVNGRPHRFFCDFPFEQVEYLLVSSKCRPYKNYAGVLEAYEQILRRHRRDLKLVVTGRLSGNQSLAAELHGRGLVFDVIEAANVPEDVHARLIRHARALVIPTFFEGAMPFGFAEAVGLGTPVAFSRIPVVEEVLAADEFAVPESFEPTDVEGMVRSILHVLDHRADVLARQRRVLERFRERTWADVAAEYLACGGIAQARRWSLPGIVGRIGRRPHAKAG
jgi:hypothetical protein